MMTKENHKLPNMTREAFELGSKEAGKRIIELKKKGKKIHDIATIMGMSEVQIIRIIKDYEYRTSKKGQLSMVNAFGIHNEEQETRSMNALKSALGKWDSKKG